MIVLQAMIQADQTSFKRQSMIASQKIHSNWPCCSFASHLPLIAAHLTAINSCLNMSINDCTLKDPSHSTMYSPKLWYHQFEESPGLARS